ncbi:MAG: nuclear transport factor 2 family protein [Solirubrobacteraceae bacterium]
MTTTTSPGHRAAARLSMFAEIERLDVVAWASHLAPDAVLRIGNGDPVHGREACRATLLALLAGIDGVRHDVVDQWKHGDATIVEANATFTRSDGREVTLPLVTIYRVDASDLISDYRVYADLAPAFEL